MNDKIRGFVLSLNDYKENDVLMQVLTKEHGIISLVGKAARKLNSRNHYLPLCLYEFIIDYKETRTIFTVHGYKLLENFYEEKDIGLMSFKNILTELCLKNREIDSYDQLLSVFEKMDTKNRYLLGCMYVSYLIRQFGITPEIDRCVLCDSSKVVAISNRHGGFLCQKHLNGHEMLSVERLRKFRMIIKAGMEHYDILSQFEYDFRDFDLLMSFFMENSDLKMRSYDLYLALNK